VRGCHVCHGVRYVVSVRDQTFFEIKSGKFAVGESVYGVRKCPACLIAGVKIGPPDESVEIQGIASEGWCQFAERAKPRPDVVTERPVPPIDPAYNRQLDEAFAKHFARVEPTPER